MFIPQARLDPSFPKPITVPYTNAGTNDLPGGTVLVANGKVQIVAGSGIRKSGSSSGPNTGSLQTGFGVFDCLTDASGSAAASTPFSLLYWNTTGTPVDQSGGTVLASTGCLTTTAAGATYFGYTWPEQPDPSIMGDEFRVRAFLDLPTLYVSAGQIASSGTVAATGSNLAGAAALTFAFNNVTGGTSGATVTNGVSLPVTPNANTSMIVKANSGTNTLKVYPDAAAQINGLGAGVAIVMASLTSCTFTSTGPTQWYTTPLVPS